MSTIFPTVSTRKRGDYGGYLKFLINARIVRSLSRISLADFVVNAQSIDRTRRFA